MKSTLWRLSSMAIRSATRGQMKSFRLARGNPSGVLWSKRIGKDVAKACLASAASSNSTFPRTNISLLGATNAGKSVLMNLLTQSDVSLVHETKGTTADPKPCLMELHGRIGPVRLLDTPGINEVGELGSLKKEKAMQTIGQSDVAVIVADPFAQMDETVVDSTAELIQQVHKRQTMNQTMMPDNHHKATSPVPLLIFNLRQEKVDKLLARGGSVSLLLEQMEQKITKKLSASKLSLPPTLAVDFTALDKSRERVIQFLERFTKPRAKSVSLLPDSLAKDTHADQGESPTVFLNIPMDQQTPSMRLLRPQAMVQEALIRNFVSTYSYRMDLGLARCDNPNIVQKEKDRFLRTLDPILKSGDLKMLITDSQAIDLVAPWTLDSSGNEIVPITTFSITMIRYLSGGRLEYFADGLRKLDEMEAGEAKPKNGNTWRVLISEACNHTRLNLEKECADIGTVQIPNHLMKILGKENLDIEYAFGKHALFDPTEFDLVVHCGGCMLTPQQMDARIADLVDSGVPTTNYGLLLSQIQSPQTLTRVLKPWGIDYDHEQPFHFDHAA